MSDLNQTISQKLLAPSCIFLPLNRFSLSELILKLGLNKHKHRFSSYPHQIRVVLILALFDQRRYISMPRFLLLIRTDRVVLDKQSKIVWQN